VSLRWLGRGSSLKPLLIVILGAFGHVTSAIVCAASSFSMSITSPAEFLRDLDVEFFRRYRSLPDTDLVPVEYVEPDLSSRPERTKSAAAVTQELDDSDDKRLRKLDKIRSKVVTLGDFIDTDAVSLPSCLRWNSSYAADIPSLAGSWADFDNLYHRRGVRRTRPRTHTSRLPCQGTGWPTGRRGGPCFWSWLQSGGRSFGIERYVFGTHID
jgi:hypothetical protein